MNNILWTVILIFASASAQAGGTPLNDHTGSEMAKSSGHLLSTEETDNRKIPMSIERGSINRGRDLFLRNCASCHGETAEGNGPAAESMTPRPANLNKMSGMHPDSDFALIIENGKGSMPAWKNILNESQIWDLVKYVQSLSGLDKARQDNSH